MKGPGLGFKVVSTKRGIVNTTYTCNAQQGIHLSTWLSVKPLLQVSCNLVVWFTIILRVFAHLLGFLKQYINPMLCNDILDATQGSHFSNLGVTISAL